MINDKLLEVINTLPDAALTIVTNGKRGAHAVNSWNSYIIIYSDDTLLIPAGRMNQTEENIKHNNKALLTLCNREVMGHTYKGTGFLLRGTAEMVYRGEPFEKIRAKFPWARAAFMFTISSVEQTL
ncbi:MAG: pyridoxamine 5'-phosphate oxidase family protein [Eubacteriales bacterium]|nr:pyridoxamine 5'-phosphate oxidase family protein [Eubacteriales bacterium]